jgi:hypothetical protein
MNDITFHSNTMLHLPLAKLFVFTAIDLWVLRNECIFIAHTANQNQKSAITHVTTSLNSVSIHDRFEDRTIHTDFPMTLLCPIRRVAIVHYSRLCAYYLCSSISPITISRKYLPIFYKPLEKFLITFFVVIKCIYFFSFWCTPFIKIRLFCCFHCRIYTDCYSRG